MVGEQSTRSDLLTTDTLIIGTGVAGLASALKLAEFRDIILVSKCEVDQTNTAMAQGGIASVIATDDHFEKHQEDTLLAGAGLCHPDIVRKVVEAGPQSILDLERWGVAFDSSERMEHQQKNLNKEGGHSHRRILHVQDQTGRAIHEALMRRVVDHPRITILENLIAIELMTEHQRPHFTTGSDRCLGATFLDKRNRAIRTIYASVTLLATGGAGKTYLYTSNWEGATGDGIAMAYRAGCRVANMEFMQFHPTCLFHQEARNFLISEALRGEGAELVNNKSHAFAYDYDPKGPLAPRDRVARAIDAEMKKTGAECVYLDIRHKGGEFIQAKFPWIFERCLSLGIDITKDLLPVVPAAHYLCGGILTDEHGRTDLLGLFAIGECANTGLHGANRLASNSLLECLTFSTFASEYIQKNPQEFSLPPIEPTPVDLKLKKDQEDELMLITHLWDEIRTCMWNYVGIVRSDKRLERALTRIKNIEQEITEYYNDFVIQSDLIELRNLATVARLSIECALARRSSVGTHFNVDLEPAKIDIEPKLNVIFPNSLH
jgi:L-aspartate oxidase